MLCDNLFRNMKKPILHWKRRTGRDFCGRCWDLHGVEVSFHLYLEQVADFVVAEPLGGGGELGLENDDWTRVLRK